MKIKRFTLSEFQVNNYLVIIGKEAILIDVGFNPQEIEDYLIENNLKLNAILLTHAHLDHIAGVEYIRNKFNAPVYLHELEKDWLTNPNLNGSEYFLAFGKIICRPADFLIINEQELNISKFTVNILHTPGHTPGGISYYIKPFIFTGDTLFCRSIGRTDLYGGNQIQLIDSIKKKLYNLPNNTTVYSGHGEGTTIADEKKHNYYIRA